MVTALIGVLGQHVMGMLITASQVKIIIVITPFSCVPRAILATSLMIQLTHGVKDALQQCFEVVKLRYA
jgi:predicted nucleotide-binding protein (sugar kinase/HSP70/actin superfamily)